MEYGLTDRGFVAKPLQQILKEEREAFVTAFGYDINTGDDSVAGAYIGNQAAKLAQLWEILEGLYWIGDSDSASGVYLDRLAAFVNVERVQAQPTQVHTALWGDQGTEILTGSLAKIKTGEEFALDSTVTINRSKLLGFTFKIVELAAAAYSIVVDSHVFNYAATEGDTEETVQAGIFDQIEAVFPGVYTAVNSGTDGMEIHSSGGVVPFAMFCDDPKIEILILGAFGLYKAVTPGPTFVSIGALDQIVSNVTGLGHIVNYASGITGREAESDAELRIEKNNRQRQASGNELAIQNAIKKISGVQYYRVYSNRTMILENGRPPKSYEAIVVGGVDEDIAKMIFEKGPAGVEAFGNTVVPVKDSEGYPWVVGFSRPESRYIWIKIAFSRNTEETFPINGVELIKDNIDAWGAANQDVGIDLIFQKLNRPVYDVPGIGFADIKVAVTNDPDTPPDADAYSSENIVINERQIALIDKTRVSIEELAV
jgi:uncharacterized phage protein gp47/JayE